ncbi:MAG TPA: hypothetical protein VMI13_03615 [Solirubrobacteraceae bacterium]|nr:hypothetical protein [Solirubrobacteraceae bacterium]
MLGVWIAVALVLLAAAIAVAWRASTRTRLPHRAEIFGLESDTSVDPETEATTSVQRADLLIDRDALAEIWTPVHLERLARTYWRFLTRVTLGLIRVRYTEGERSVVLVAPPLRLLVFKAPEYEMDASHGLVRWRISRGLLVSKRGRDPRGYLQIEVRRPPEDDGDTTRTRLHVEVAVANFYPSIASGLGRTIYNVTQSRIHVIVTNGFLRSLTRLDLAESRVGRLRGQ